MPRLVTVSRDDLDIVRRRRGRGFAYVDAGGRAVTDPAFRRRVDGLVIPPAWRDVHVSLHPRAHIQAFGTDEAGRVQYIYHPDWEETRTRRKQLRLGRLLAALPRIRRRIAIDLQAEAGSTTLATAIAVALIDRTAMRVGRERYLEERGTRGAGTLYSRDVQLDGDTISIAFPAKGGKDAHYTITDPRLAAALARIKTLPGKRLLVHRAASGKLKPIRTNAINAYLREISGAEICAKDFRTLHASARAGEALASVPLEASESARKRQIARISREVSDFLRNTPMVCRKSYIVPVLFALFDSGRLHELWLQAGAWKGERGRERRLGVVLAAAARA